MGAAHFKQMYADAVDIDRRALPVFAKLVRPGCLDKRLFGGGFWDSMPADVIMDKARSLVQLGDAYLLHMKQLLVDGKTAVFVPTADGPVRVRDPRVIDFDEPTIPAALFFDGMMAEIDEFCSGDQN